MLATALLALAVSTSASENPAAAPQSRPNVVVIVWNDLALEHVGFLDAPGDPRGVTPRLDALFADGARFPLGTRVCARGLPSTAALLTGRHPHRSGVFHPLASAPLAPEGTLVQTLHAHGYAALLVGKSPFGPATGTVFERGVGSAAANAPEPSARFVGEFAGKRPLLVWWAPEGGAADLDHALGFLLDALDAQGQRANTLFVFASGGEPDVAEFSAKECGAAGMRSPLALAWKGRIPAGTHAERVTPLDVAPTVLELVGLAAPAGSDGRSLRALLAGEPWPERALGAAFFAQPPERGGKAPREPGRDLQALAFLDGRWKYVLYLHDVGLRIDTKAEQVEIERSAGDQSLFDLEADPEEGHDLFPDRENAARVDGLRAAALEWWRASAGPEFTLPYLQPSLGPPPAEPRPNIVLVVADDMDYEHPGFLGNPRARTPTLDELARTGVVFPVAHVPMSRCRPSLAALLGGRWPNQSGIFDNEVPRTLARRDSLPNLLKAAGYATFQGGKFWEGSPFSMGFLEPRSADNVFLASFQTFVRESQAELFRFIDRYHAERPLFVWWAPMLPHAPFDPPARFRELFRDTDVPVPPGIEGDAHAFQEAERTAYAMDAWFDSGLAELRAKLEETGELADTLFVFLIDNGYANGFPSKGTAFEKGLRTPLVVSWPKGVAGGRTRPELVSSLDVYETILDYAGVPVPPGVAGVSLRPALEGREHAAREALYGAVYDYRANSGSQRPADSMVALYARTVRWKFVLYLRRADPESVLFDHAFAPFPVRERGERDLFDLQEDPYERNDLSGDPARAKLMDELLRGCLEWWSSTGGGDLDLPATSDGR